MAMHMETPRFLLRDFSEADRQSFIDYQMDPRYQALYDWVDTDPGRATTLFDLFSDGGSRTHARTFKSEFSNGQVRDYVAAEVSVRQGSQKEQPSLVWS